MNEILDWGVSRYDPERMKQQILGYLKEEPGVHYLGGVYLTHTFHTFSLEWVDVNRIFNYSLHFWFLNKLVTDPGHFFKNELFGYNLCYNTY